MMSSFCPPHLSRSGDATVGGVTFHMENNPERANQVLELKAERASKVCHGLDKSSGWGLFYPTSPFTMNAVQLSTMKHSEAIIL